MRFSRSCSLSIPMGVATKTPAAILADIMGIAIKQNPHPPSLADIFRIKALGLGDRAGLERSIELVGVTID